MLFDSHAHYNDSKFDEDRTELLSSMQQNNIGMIMNAADSVESVKEILAICERFPFIYASCGVHPENTLNMTDNDIEILRSYTKHERVKAIGEIGLDYYWDDVPRDIQKEWFIKQIHLANEVDLPVIIHDRDAHGDTMDIIRDVGYYTGVFHCYSGSPEMAKQLLDMGLYFSFAGPITFKNGKKPQEAALAIPMDRLFIETDSPYLTPEPHRGKRNDSSMVRFVCEKLAELKGLSVEETARITYENGKRFFGIQ